MKKDDVWYREKLLIDILKNLSELTFDVKSQMDDVISKLHEVYDLGSESKDEESESKDEESKFNVYRHSYSKIFILLSEIHKSTETTNSNETLNQNLESVYYECQKRKNETKPFKMAVYKLYDHVNLDIARIHFLEKENMDYYAQFLEGYKELESDFKNSQQEFKTTKEEVRNLAERSKLDIVAILGVFTAIVIGVVSSVAFSSQLLAHAHEIPAGRVLIAASACGFVSISVFYMIYSLLEKIVFKADKEQSPSFLSHLQNWRNWSIRDAIIPATLIFLGCMFLFGCLTMNADPGSSSVTVQISDK